MGIKNTHTNNNNNNNNNLFLRDIYATKIFRDVELRDFVVKVISKVLKREESDVKKNLRMLDSKVSDNVHLIDSEVDAIYENDENYYNIEINMNRSLEREYKNLSYLCHLYLKPLHNSKNYDPKMITQINLDCFDRFGKEEFIYESTIMEKNYMIPRDKKFNIVDINVAELQKLSYNELGEDSLERLLYFLACGDLEILSKLYDGDETMEKVSKKLESLSRDVDDILYYNPEELNEYGAFHKGKEEGIYENKIEIAKNLLQRDMTVAEISEITGLSIQEIENLK